MNSLNFKKLFGLALVMVFMSSCKPFDPTAPLSKKWDRVSSWVPSSPSYLVVADFNALSKTEFFRKAFLSGTEKTIPLLSGFNVETEVGIMVFADDLMFIGGKFNPKELTERIKSSLKEDNDSVTEEKYKDKIIFTEEKDGSSFVFLEKHLVCEGKIEKLKELINQHTSSKPGPAGVDTSHILFGRLNNYKNSFSKVTDLTFFADIDSEVKINAVTKFSSEKEAIGFADEAEGIKTIKTIQSVDEPWLADFLDGINIKRVDSEVVLSTTLDVSVAKTLLKKVMQ